MQKLAETLHNHINAYLESTQTQLKGIVHTKIKIVIIYSHVVPNLYALFSYEFCFQLDYSFF